MDINVNGSSQTLMSTRSLMQSWSFPVHVCALTLMPMDDVIINQSNDYFEGININVDAKTLGGNYTLVKTSVKDISLHSIPPDYDL